MKDIADILQPERGIIAVIGSGDRSGFILKLVGELSRRGRVILCTTMGMKAPDGIVTVTDERISALYKSDTQDRKELATLCSDETNIEEFSLRAISQVLDRKGLVCVGAQMRFSMFPGFSATSGERLGPARLEPAKLCEIADYVVVDADSSSAGLPIMLHNEYGPVIPEGTKSVIWTVGLSGIGCFASDAVYRFEMIDELTGMQVIPGQTRVSCRMITEIFNKEKNRFFAKSSDGSISELIAFFNRSGAMTTLGDERLLAASVGVRAFAGDLSADGELEWIRM